jgi:hypothetical protein
MKKTTLILACLAAIFSTSAFAQDSREIAQAKLTQAFQGKSVSLKVDMPATDKGVDLTAGKAKSIAERSHEKRLKNYGTAIKNGETSVITGVGINGDEVVLELAGGGAPDLDLVARIGPKPEGTTLTDNRESQARVQANSARALGSDQSNANSTLRYESSTRKRDDAAREAVYYTRRDNEIAKDRETRLKMGSRFVIKMDKARMASITPEELTKLLSAYVSF